MVVKYVIKVDEFIKEIFDNIYEGYIKGFIKDFYGGDVFKIFIVEYFGGDFIDKLFLLDIDGFIIVVDVSKYIYCLSLFLVMEFFDVEFWINMFVGIECNWRYVLFWFEVIVQG